MSCPRRERYKDENNQTNGDDTDKASNKNGNIQLPFDIQNIDLFFIRELRSGTLLSQLPGVSESDLPQFNQNRFGECKY